MLWGEQPSTSQVDLCLMRPLQTGWFLLLLAVFPVVHAASFRFCCPVVKPAVIRFFTSGGVLSCCCKFVKQCKHSSQFCGWVT